MKNNIIFLVSTFLFILIIYITAIPLSSTETFSSQETGTAIISILSEDHTPINNAIIKIAETQEYTTTNKLGSSTLTLPAYSTNKLEKYTNPQKNWTEYTIIVYANGYYPHIYFGLKIIQNIKKTGIVISLKSLNFSNDTPYTTSYEYPNPDWIENLIETNKNPW